MCNDTFDRFLKYIMYFILRFFVFFYFENSSKINKKAINNKKQKLKFDTIKHYSTSRF